MRGTLRTLDDDVRASILRQMAMRAEGCAQAYACEVEIANADGYPVTVNDPQATNFACAAAKSAGFEVKRVGSGVTDELRPLLASEDFSFVLREKPGAYVFLGNGEKCAALHSPAMKFKKEALSFGGQWFCKLGLAER